MTGCRLMQVVAWAGLTVFSIVWQTMWRGRDGTVPSTTTASSTSFSISSWRPWVKISLARNPGPPTLTWSWLVSNNGCTETNTDAHFVTVVNSMFLQMGLVLSFFTSKGFRLAFPGMKIIKRALNMPSRCLGITNVLPDLCPLLMGVIFNTYTWGTKVYRLTVLMGVNFNTYTVD